MLASMACKNSASDKKDDKRGASEISVSEPMSGGKTAALETSSTFQLLQGKWQSMDDKSDFLVFENNHRKEKSSGVDKWDDDVFTLSDHCINESDSSSTVPKEKDKYLSCKEFDLCWYISLLDANRLKLTYVGRGNELVYKRVKD